MNSTLYSVAVNPKVKLGCNRLAFAELVIVRQLLDLRQGRD